MIIRKRQNFEAESEGLRKASLKKYFVFLCPSSLSNSGKINGKPKDKYFIREFCLDKSLNKKQHGNCPMLCFKVAQIIT